MSRTPEKPYDVAPNFGTLLDKHRQLPFKRFADLVTAKVEDLVEMLARPTPYDQGPGREVPYSIPVWFGPLPLTTARRTNTTDDEAAAGFELLAQLATPDKPYVPNDGNIVIGRDLSFIGRSMMAYGFVNWGYKSSPGFDVPYTNAQGVGDILDPVGDDPSVGPNGGAMPLDFFGGTFSTLSSSQPDLPNISFEVELYDKLRGRRMHDKKLPMEMFAGGRMAHRKLASPLRFEKGSIIEPRLFVNEIRMGSVLNTTAAFNAASVKVWVCLVFKGVQRLEVPNV